MTRRLSTIVLISLLAFAFMAMSAFAAKNEVPRVHPNPLIWKSVGYAFAAGGEQGNPTMAPKGDLATRTLGTATPSASPGTVVGDTWYEYQRNGSMRRMVGFGPHSGGSGIPTVHFSWMWMPSEAAFGSDRRYRYNFYKADDGSFAGDVPVQAGGDYAGYVVADVTTDNRVVIGGHNNPGTRNSTHIYWDFLEHFQTFTKNSRVPDSVQQYLGGFGAEGPTAQSTIWPAIAYQETGATPVTHVIAASTTDNGQAGDPSFMYYFRKVGVDNAGTWDYPPRVLDTNFTLSQDISASRTTQKVAIAFMANIPKVGDCDTCSNNDGALIAQQDNDVYLFTSDDGGVTFNPRQNITQYVRDEDGFRAYIDLSVLIRSDDEVSIAWGAREWPGTCSVDATGDCGLFRGRLFYWASDVGSIRTIYNGQWDQTECNSGVWNLNFSKMQLGECDGKLYCLWVQFNDIPRGVEDDCAARAADGDFGGAANGELYVSVSDDNGITWDESRNVTNSRTPGCDSATGTGGPCFSDHWPSMTRFGHTQQVGENWSQASYVDVDGSYAGDDYLDVQYIQDGDPGGSVQTEGTWALSNVAWFRLACVEPVRASQFSVNPTSIGFPNWTKHGVQADKDVLIENLGNEPLTYSINAVETAGPSGWLATGANFDGAVPSGIGNQETGTISFNTGGIVNSPGTIVYLAGFLEFVHNAASSPDTLELEYWVADTVIAPVFDTISTGVVDLVVNSAGNFGNQGADSVTMDYAGDVTECDSLATVYLYDGTPVVGWVDGTDTVMNWSIFGDGWLSDNGLRPRGHTGPSNETGNAGDSYEKYVAEFFTNDSSICLTKTWYAPTSGGGAGVSVGNYILQELSLTLCDTRTRSGLLIGEAIDWDIPADSAVDNGSGFDDTRGIIWQFGGEYNQDDTTECQDNDARYGALGYLGGDQAGLSAYTADNATYVLNVSGFEAGQMYDRMVTSVAFETFSSPDPDSLFVDLHSAMVFTKNASLNIGDTLSFRTVLITIQNGTDADVQASFDDAQAWYQANLSTGCCIGTTGDFDGDGIDAGPIDLAAFVDFLFAGGSGPVCPEEADFDGDGTSAGPIDLAAFVDFLFAGGAGPVPCP